MPVSKKDKTPSTVVLYDVADDALKKEKGTVVTNKYSTKNTLNLLMKEKSSISFELFFLLLAIIMLLLALVEYFVVYRPYRAVEQAEAALREEQARLEQILDKIKDYDDVRADYLKYNYENFDSSIVDRLDILDLLERKVFGVGKIQSMNISGNTLTMTMTEVSVDASSKLQSTLQEEAETGIVEYVSVTRTGYNSGEDGVPTVNIVITFKNADEGGN